MHYYTLGRHTNIQKWFEINFWQPAECATPHDIYQTVKGIPGLIYVSTFMDVSFG